MEVFRGATALNTLPKSVRPFFGAILKWRFFGIAKKCLKKCAPEIEKRLDENKRKRENPAYDWTPPVGCTPNQSFLLNEEIFTK